VPDRTADEVRVLVGSEVRKIANGGIVEGIQTFLITPRLEMRTWGWEKTPVDYPVWIVAESSRYDYGIAFSDYGFAPEHPWGLFSFRTVTSMRIIAGIRRCKMRTKTLDCLRSIRNVKQGRGLEWQRSGFVNNQVLTYRQPYRISLD
jgi:hypothetical protein